jgi:hypothetical protein
VRHLPILDRVVWGEQHDDIDDQAVVYPEDKYDLRREK